MRYTHRETALEVEYLDGRVAEEQKRTRKEPKRSKFYHEALAKAMFYDEHARRTAADFDLLKQILLAVQEEVTTLRAENRTLHMMQAKQRENKQN
ncbi:hypothetical protein LFL96_26015 [Paraburkholderia sp. D15]|uniref:hypothetical protein n=1 Tax=Paraburkholderia sp. D15 TaxID=2880218 RepID=UPI0024794B4B|nr:hypothetical protein [Paraburkholderia sp. D15]WGS54473.1 hypothetical protein LFL96_26015 [Paraburkholderia sp. D15]